MRTCIMKLIPMFNKLDLLISSCKVGAFKGQNLCIPIVFLLIPLRWAARFYGLSSLAYLLTAEMAEGLKIWRGEF